MRHITVGYPGWSMLLISMVSLWHHSRWVACSQVTSARISITLRRSQLSDTWFWEPARRGCASQPPCTLVRTRRPTVTYRVYTDITRAKKGHSKCIYVCVCVQSRGGSHFRAGLLPAVRLGAAAAALHPRAGARRARRARCAARRRRARQRLPGVHGSHARRFLFGYLVTSRVVRRRVCPRMANQARGPCARWCAVSASWPRPRCSSMC